MGQTTKWIAATMLGILVIVATACRGGTDNGPSVVRAHGTPTVADTLARPGTALGDGFTVPRGASLVGIPLPDSLYTGYSGLRAVRRWSALLLITGNAAAVTNDLIRQAARKGLHVDPNDYNPAGTGCRETGTPRSGLSTFELPLPTTRRPVGIRCSVRIISDATVRPSLPRRTLSFDARQGKCFRCGAPIWASLATLRYSDFEPATVDPPISAPTPTAELPIVPTTASLKLPMPGDVLYFAGKGVEVRVVTGSQPLTPPASGFTVLMRVEHGASGERALSAYLRRTKRRTLGTTRSREVRDGWNVHTLSANDADTGVEYELFQRTGEPSYLRVTVT